MIHSEKSVESTIKKCKSMQSRLIISILYYSAATSKDVIHVTYKDFNIFNHTVRLGNAEYKLPGHIITALCEHVAKSGNRTGNLFTGIQNKPLYHKYIATVVSDNFGKLTKPHHIRQSRISHWMKLMPKEHAKRMGRMHSRAKR